MLTHRSANNIFTVFILLAAIYFAIEALGFEDPNVLGTSQLSSNFFPLTSLIFIFVCGVITLLQQIRADTEKEPQNDFVFENWHEALVGAMTFGVAVAGFLVWTFFGFVPMALLMGPALGLVMGVRSIPIYALLVVLGYAVYLIFHHLLGIELG